MDRKKYLQKFISKDMLGLEIAPYHSPILPKKDGWRCQTVDIYDQERLKALATQDPHDFVREKCGEIEFVDIIASAIDLESAIREKGGLGTFDYICSSHNFEHLPDPIKFLKACGATLKPGGYLSMAIPNKRKTFDFARPLTSTADWLRWFHDGQTQADPFMEFEFKSCFVELSGDNVRYHSQIEDAYKELCDRKAVRQYTDIHFSVFTPASFSSLINDLMILDLIPLRLDEMYVDGIEFMVHMKNIGYEKVSALKKQLVAHRRKLAAVAFRS